MKVAKLTAALSAMITLVAALWFMVVSLNRWQWNRTLFFGLIALAAIIVLATGLILHRLGRVEARLTQHQQQLDAAVLSVLAETRPARPRRFEWLAPDRTNVFIGFLIGAGVIVSAIAWAIDRIAARTATRTGEQYLARELTDIGYPDGGFVREPTGRPAPSFPGSDPEHLRILLGDYGPDR